MMKKLTLLLCILWCGGFAYSQTLLTQDFSGSTFPPTGWTIDANASNWSKVATTNAAGTSPEARFYYAPQFNGTSRLISPAVNTTGSTSLIISFKQFVDWYANPFSLLVQTRSGGGAWNTALTINPTGNIGPEVKLLLVNNADVGASDFQFCLTYSGDSYNIDYWYVDDISLSVANPLDAGMMALTMVAYQAAATVPVTGKIINYGTSPLTDVNINWSLDNGVVHTSALSGMSLTLGQTNIFSATDPVTFTPGVHSLACWVSNANGAVADSNVYNDTIVKTFYIASLGTSRRPLYEEFTSSTCAPCAAFNGPTFDPFLVAHANEISFVHYPMNWPGSGDPYYTLQNLVRRIFYGVSYVPDLYVEGKQVPTTAAGINSALTTSLNNPAFMQISGTHTVTGSIVAGEMNIASNITANLTAYIAIVERETTGNVATNGETHFPNVMMCMAPSPYGTPVQLTDGNTTTVTFSVDMTGTHVEQLSDLRVVLWVQDSVSRMLFQSNYSVDLGVGINNLTSALEQIQVYPNPSTGLVNIRHQSTIADLKVYNSFGQIVRQYTDFEANMIDLSSLNNGSYFMTISNGSASRTIKLALIK